MSKTSKLEIYAAWPKNPTYIEFKRSDGNSDSWPTSTTQVVDHEGQVNFFQHLLSENAQNKRWRHMVGEAVAKSLNMPTGPSYVLRDFPKDYRFYDHHKGPAAKPRHDVYLYGSPGKRFRSITEFIPHASWLMNDNLGRCDCKYCTKRTQKEVTAELGAAGVIPATQSMSPGPPRIKLSRPKGKGRDPMNRLRDRQKREERVYAAVQRVVRPKLASPSANVLPMPMLADRHNDLRAVYSKTSMELARWFREGEVVWCWLQHPIVHPEYPSITIQFWPGVVDEAKLKSIPVPRRPGHNPYQDDNAHLSPSTRRNGSSTFQAGLGPSLEPNDEPLPWVVQQSTEYKVQLLAVSHSYVVPDESVIPYSAYMPSEELLNFMQTIQPEQLVFDKDSLSKFNPCVGPVPPSIFDTVPAYAAALQIGSVLSSYWCLTDDYEVNYTISPSPPTTPKSFRPPLPSRLATQPSPLSAQPLIPQGADSRTSISATPNSYHRNVQGVHPDMTPAELEQTKRHILGGPPPVGDFTQTKFQGMWWGAERIWTDDFIRLKLPRRAFAPYGNDAILPPSGPGPTVMDTWRGLGKTDFSELGAGSRGLFLRLDNIFAVEVPSEGGTKKDPRVSGQLYELADEDWEETDKNLLANNLGGAQGSTSSISGLVTNPETPSGMIGSIPPVDNVLKGSDYPLPLPPKGYRFRPILAPDQEFVGALSLLSGRYYPRVLSHPKLKETVDEALDRSWEEGGVTSSDNLWALEGLSGGYYNAMDPYRYQKSRVAMFQDADKEAISTLTNYVEQRRQEAEQATNGSMIDPMEIDIDDIYA
ncbi:hypothetical protein CPB83DRAFT_905381 [Crepidotus variabilis]|uniref:Cryptic loci regulator 2 N-terminal domain-containing protein n=1 Tax=Crepidotus variabilis TaxID=179855 RepID=A0A9P6EIR9_9AGAR|nr:hypothetical protein CPB83DRAFT_905381 [Crepidotus variabilis]